MADALSPAAMLATSMHAPPGVYAALLGSGVSTGTGVINRWRDLLVFVRQVAARPEAVGGMAPWAHAAATVIKLHGDYMDLGSRNTPDELGTYPAEWKALLRQVTDEYGLIISGWSAMWDEALVSALEDAPN